MGRQQIPYILAGVVLMTLQPILVTLSQDGQGQTAYSPVSSTLLSGAPPRARARLPRARASRSPGYTPRRAPHTSELAKIAISLALLGSSGGQVALSAEAFQYAVPAFIYFVNNNLVFAILSHVDATSFQLLSQLKTVFTGLLFRLFLGRPLSAYQYLAIVQLAAGTATSQLPLCAGGGSGGAAQGGGRSSALGVLLSVLSCVLSAFGGIYSEKLLKEKPRDSIHWQNIQLYSWGIAFNLVGVLSHSGTAALGPGFFDGFRGWAWAVVLNNACNGLAISAILKYADNIARVYAHACAMLVTMALSVALFGQSPTPQLLIAIVMVAASAVQYNLRIDDVRAGSGAPQLAYKSEPAGDGDSQPLLPRAKAGSGWDAEL